MTKTDPRPLARVEPLLAAMEDVALDRLDRREARIDARTRVLMTARRLAADTRGLRLGSAAERDAEASHNETGG